MTICEYGTRAKSNYQAAFWVTGEAVCAVVQAAFPAAFPWVEIGCNVMLAQLYDPDTKCADVPDDPGPAPWDLAATTGTLPALPDILSWMWAWFQRQQWSEYCECVPAPLTTVCSWTQQYTVSRNTATGWVHVDSIYFTSLTTAWTITLQTNSKTPNDTYLGFRWTLYAADNYTRINRSRTVVAPDTLAVTLSAADISGYGGHAGPYRLELESYLNVNVQKAGTYTMTVAVGTADCWQVAGPTPSPYVPPANPTITLPDPPSLEGTCTTDDLCLMTRQLQSMLAIISTEVDETYLWTQAFQGGGSSAISSAYDLGTNHTGLTGQGEITLATAILGLAVSVTTAPSWAGFSPGDPVTLHGIGHLTPGTTHGWDRTVQIRKNPQLIFQRFQPWTKVGYSLQPGVTIAVRELVAA